MLVDLQYLCTPQERAREKEKLKFRRSGPYAIIEKLFSHTYRLDLPCTCRAHNVFNIAALTRYRENTLEGRRVEPPPPIEMEDGSEEWIVDKILAHRRVGKGVQYLTVYAGYRDIDATWQPRRDFMNNGHVTNQILKNYEKEHGLP